MRKPSTRRGEVMFARRREKAKDVEVRREVMSLCGLELELVDMLEAWDVWGVERRPS